ncbi:hypothetical protein GDO81_006945 [Engystomops pustulosus]|uniref:Secreted protein n=1 Tax=Engystomops pustulosus TaxID=76066 RepID=A0AAV7D117_ENGPU|nr:hypothetical protein GDO81_006945 [Engystomops pustulosus]
MPVLSASGPLWTCTLRTVGPTWLLVYRFFWVWVQNSRKTSLIRGLFTAVKPGPRAGVRMCDTGIRRDSRRLNTCDSSGRLMSLISARTEILELRVLYPRAERGRSSRILLGPAQEK